MSAFFARYRKAITASLGATATWAVSTFPDNLDVQRFVGLAVALLTAAGVYAIPNHPDPVPDPALVSVNPAQEAP